MNKKVKEAIKRKKWLKEKYKAAFSIVKKYIDKLDLMHLLDIAPADEYDFETADIVPFAIKTKDVNILADIIIKVFGEAVDEDFNMKRKEITEAAKNILNELRLVSPIKKETYIIPKDLLPGSCYFEFQPGKFSMGKYWFSKMDPIRLDTSIYLYGNDDGNFDYSVIAPFTYLIDGFNYTGITYVNENDGQVLVENLRKFAVLLGEGRVVYEALELIGVYNPNTDGSWYEQDAIDKLDLTILKNTAEELADWIEKKLKEHKMISILGI